MYSAGFDGAVRAWDLRQLRSSSRMLPLASIGDRSPVRLTRLAADDQYLCVGATDNSAYVVDLAAEGTVNAIYRLGDELAVRLPLRPGVVRGDLERAAAASAELAAAASVPSPTLVEIGEPGAGYPSPWSVQTWIDGTTATAQPPLDHAAFGEDLGRLVLELRSVPTDGRVFSGGGLRYHHGDIALAATDGGSALTWEVRLTPWVPGTGLVVRAMLARQFEDDLEVLSEVVLF